MHTIAQVMGMIQAWHTAESAQPGQHERLAEIEQALGRLQSSNGQTNVQARTYHLSPPQQFCDYVASNYFGEVVFSDPQWHAKRLWNAAMKASLPLGLPSSPFPEQKYDDTLLPFLELMRAELHANTAKGDRPGWLTMSPEKGLLEIYWHTAKLSAAVKNKNTPAIKEHAADVANMSMMLLDVCVGIVREPAIQTADAEIAPTLSACPGRTAHFRDISQPREQLQSQQITNTSSPMPGHPTAAKETAFPILGLLQTQLSQAAREVHAIHAAGLRAEEDQADGARWRAMMQAGMSGNAPIMNAIVAEVTRLQPRSLAEFRIAIDRAFEGVGPARPAIDEIVA